MIPIDSQKAFDTINHNISLKYVSVGFSFQSIEWFDLHLSNRRFQVNIIDKYSNVAYINCEIPQGSILGSLLFPLCTNDMSQAVNYEFFFQQMTLV